jgi:transposase
LSTAGNERSDNDVRKERVWARLLGLERAVVESVEIDDKEQVVVAVRPHHRERDRCGVCGHRCSGFDLGEGRRRVCEHIKRWEGVLATIS